MSPVNSALPLTLSLKLTTSAVSTSSSLYTKFSTASWRKWMLSFMLPLVSRTSTMDRGTRSEGSPWLEASRK